MKFILAIHAQGFSHYYDGNGTWQQDKSKAYDFRSKDVAEAQRQRFSKFTTDPINIEEVKP